MLYKATISIVTSTMLHYTGALNSNDTFSNSKLNKEDTRLVCFYMHFQCLGTQAPKCTIFYNFYKKS